MSEEKLDLRRRLHVKTREIERVVAKALDLGDVNDMDPSALRRLEQDVEHLLEGTRGCPQDDVTLHEWQARDRRLRT